MNFFTCIAVSTLLLAVPTAAQSQDNVQSEANPTQLELARQIIDTAYPDEVREPMFIAVSEQIEQQAMASMMQQLGDLPVGARKVLQEWQASLSNEQRDILREHIPTLMQAWAVSYANLFSEAELRDILAFVQTDTGQTFMLRSTDVMSDPAFAAANQAYIGEITAHMLRRIPDLSAALSEAFEGQ